MAKHLMVCAAALIVGSISSAYAGDNGPAGVDLSGLIAYEGGGGTGSGISTVGVPGPAQAIGYDGSGGSGSGISTAGVPGASPAGGTFDGGGGSGSGISTGSAPSPSPAGGTTGADGGGGSGAGI